MTDAETMARQEWSPEPSGSPDDVVDDRPDQLSAPEAEELLDAPLVLLLSGPNLNLLGEGEPEIYGTDTLDDHVALAETAAADYGLVFEHFQSNHEGELVDIVHGERERASAIIVNAGALTHYALSLHDALASFDGYVV